MEKLAGMPLVFWLLVFLLAVIISLVVVSVNKDPRVAIYEKCAGSFVTGQATRVECAKAVFGEGKDREQQ